MAEKIAVDFGGTNIRVAVVSGRRIKAKATIATEPEKGFDVSYGNIIETIRSMWKHNIKSINICCPAPMDIERGVILGPRNLPGWKHVPIRENLERIFHVRCRLNNDANCFALGEALYGAGRGHHTVAGIILGTGLGMGIVINKDIFEGNSSAAGEIGRIPFRKGELEDYCSSHFFKKHPKAVEDEARKGNRNALKEYKEFGKNVGAMLGIVVNTIDPEIIVLGGGISNAYDLFRDEMMKELKKSIYPLSFEKIKIVKSGLKDAALLGAASLSQD